MANNLKALLLKMETTKRLSFKSFFNLFSESNELIGNVVKENNDHSNLNIFYSWLSPSGEFFPIPNMETHDSWMYRYMRRKGMIDLDIPRGHIDVVETAFTKGWCRITRYGDSVYCHNSVYKPSGKILKALIDSAIEHNMGKIVWDSEDDEKVLWSEHDL